MKGLTITMYIQRDIFGFIAHLLPKIRFLCLVFQVISLGQSIVASQTVAIDQGILEGIEEFDRNGDLFYAFLSIPYAKPPIGDLRFKAPQKPDGWEGTKMATEDLPTCYQMAQNGTKIGDEDCLYLNVFTPELPTNDSELKSVMVFIHGGGFTYNSGRRDLFSPEFLITRDIVLVTINYRLGILGGFSLEDENVGNFGNAGMKDQVMALQWVQENIDKFGGNPQNVTIFGQSAGGCSVHYLVLSPKTEGLFQGAIIQSGTAITPWAVGVRNNGLKLAEVLNIQTDDLNETLANLTSLSAEEIIEGQDLLSTSLDMRWGRPWDPIVELHSQEPFLIEDPLVSIETGNYNDVTIMIGYNDAEGISYYTNVTDFFDMVPDDLEIEEESDTALQLADEIKQFYFGEDEPSIDVDVQPFIQINTDTRFGFPAYRAAREHVKTSQSPVYFYRFSADTQMNLYKLRSNETAELPGATHCDELGYLFDSEMTPEDIPELEKSAMDRVLNLWTNFAKFGNPTPFVDDDPIWPTVTTEEMNYLDIGTNSSIVGVDPDAKSMKFWSDVYTTHFRSNAVVNLVLPLAIGFGIFITQLM